MYSRWGDYQVPGSLKRGNSDFFNAQLRMLQHLRLITKTMPIRLKSVIEEFREKYAASGVKEYYSKFDVAVVAEMG